MNGKGSCYHNKTKKEIVISEPYPEVLTLNVSWDNLQNSYSDILNFSASIPLKMKVPDLFSVEN